jgi:oxygen-independent coproporphyrinogen-3 oxidase
MQHALAGNAVSNQTEVARADLPFEFMLGALRLAGGFELAQFTERTGLPVSAVMRKLEAGEQRGLLTLDREGAAGLVTKVRPTVRGFDFLSDLQSIFLPEQGRARQAEPELRPVTLPRPR